MRNKTYKCGYKHCQDDTPLTSDIAIKSGTSYYHPQCLKEKQDKQQIRTIFCERINPNEIMGRLNKVIDNIIHDKNISSEFLLYALCYTIRHKAPLNHAAGLYYLINNDDVKLAYTKYKNSLVAKVDINQVATEEAVSFKIETKSENKGWGGLLE